MPIWSSALLELLHHHTGPPTKSFHFSLSNFMLIRCIILKIWGFEFFLQIWLEMPIHAPQNFGFWESGPLNLTGHHWCKFWIPLKTAFCGYLTTCLYMHDTSMCNLNQNWFPNQSIIWCPLIRVAAIWYPGLPFVNIKSELTSTLNSLQSLGSMKCSQVSRVRISFSFIY